MPKILVIDDEPMNVMALEAMCSELNFKIDRAFNGAVAIESILTRMTERKPMYSLILCDYSMPNLDGPSTVRKILKMFRKLPT